MENEQDPKLDPLLFALQTIDRGAGYSHAMAELCEFIEDNRMRFALLDSTDVCGEILKHMEGIFRDDYGDKIRKAMAMGIKATGMDCSLQGIIDEFNELHPSPLPKGFVIENEQQWHDIINGIDPTADADGDGPTNSEDA